MIYESTRDINRKLNPSEAILQGLSEEGGLFVLRDLGKNKLDLEKLIGKSYYEVAVAVLRLFVDFSDEEIKNCVEAAYRGKFSHENITPLVELKDGHILELFNGPTSAFKDVGLSLLPQLTKTALTKVEDKNDILILTATSGDTGKAALEGFKDVDRTKIMVFYPNDGVSTVQKTQMQTQEAAVPLNNNIISLDGSFIGELKFYGQGAGKFPTGNAIVQDIVDINEGSTRVDVVIKNDLSYSEELTRRNYLVRSSVELSGELAESVEQYKGNFYVKTKEISLKQLADLVDEVKEKDSSFVVAKFHK